MWLKESFWGQVMPERSLKELRGVRRIPGPFQGQKEPSKECIKHCGVPVREKLQGMLFIEYKI